MLYIYYCPICGTLMTYRKYIEDNVVSEEIYHCELGCGQYYEEYNHGSTMINVGNQKYYASYADGNYYRHYVVDEINNLRMALM